MSSTPPTRLDDVLLTYGTAVVSGSLGLILLASNPVVDRLDHVLLVAGAAALTLGLVLAALRFLRWVSARRFVDLAPRKGGEPKPTEADAGDSHPHPEP